MTIRLRQRGVAAALCCLLALTLVSCGKPSASAPYAAPPSSGKSYSETSAGKSTVEPSPDGSVDGELYLGAMNAFIAEGYETSVPDDDMMDGSAGVIQNKSFLATCDDGFVAMVLFLSFPSYEMAGKLYDTYVNRAFDSCNADDNFESGYSYDDETTNYLLEFKYETMESDYYWYIVADKYVLLCNANRVGLNNILKVFNDFGFHPSVPEVFDLSADAGYAPGSNTGTNIAGNIKKGDPEWIPSDFENEGKLADFFGTNSKDKILSHESFPIIDILVFSSNGGEGGFINFPAPDIVWSCLKSMFTLDTLSETGEIIDLDQEGMTYTVSADTVIDLMNSLFNIPADSLPLYPDDDDVVYHQDSNTYTIRFYFSGGAYSTDLVGYRVEGNKCTIAVSIFSDGGDDYESENYVLVLEKNPNSRAGYSIIQFQNP